MWTCSVCGRIFEKAKQPHSCRKTPLELHFQNKEKARELFDYLVKQVNKKVGKCKIVSLPCCVHLFGKYDFLAVLPKRDGLEIRFALDHQLKSPRIMQRVPISSKNVKNCLQVKSKAEVDGEFIGWLSRAYHLKDKQ
jgi:hypothetical protein